MCEKHDQSEANILITWCKKKMGNPSERIVNWKHLQRHGLIAHQFLPNKTNIYK